jgi:REP-associated tyrosine transposase
MPRPPRIHVPGGVYHATLRGNHRQDIFNRESERTLLNLIVSRALEKYAARLLAYCWMTNHLHFLLQVGETPLGRLMQQIASEYARAFQSSLATTGHLFENRYYATIVATDAYLLEALRYVHQNPVRAGLVSNAAEYPWSSHRVYLGDAIEPWVTTDFALAQFSEDRARAIVRFRAFVDAIPPADIAAELAALDKGVPLLGKPELLARDVRPPDAGSTLEEIVGDACRHFSVTVVELRSPLRTSRLVTARAWIAMTATRHGIATMAAIARELHRDESTLRAAMRKYVRVIEEDQISPRRSSRA